MNGASDGEHHAGEHEEELHPHDPAVDPDARLDRDGDVAPEQREPDDRRDRERDRGELVDSERADAADAVGREPAQHDQEDRDRGHADREDPVEPVGPHRAAEQQLGHGLLAGDGEERDDEGDEPDADEGHLAHRERSDAVLRRSSRVARCRRPSSPVVCVLSSACSSVTMFLSRPAHAARIDPILPAAHETAMRRTESHRADASAEALRTRAGPSARRRDRPSPAPDAAPRTPSRPTRRAA